MQGHRKTLKVRFNVMVHDPALLKMLRIDCKVACRNEVLISGEVKFCDGAQDVVSSLYSTAVPLPAPSLRHSELPVHALLSIYVCSVKPVVR